MKLASPEFLIGVLLGWFLPQIWAMIRQLLPGSGE